MWLIGVSGMLCKVEVSVSLECFEKCGTLKERRKKKKRNRMNRLLIKAARHLL